MIRLWVIAVAALVTAASSTGNGTDIPNANHIFNAIHSSMRQWGSSVNHNGMSLFLATVPLGTILYHGSPESEPRTGMEWVAFELEHATQFARIFFSPGILPPTAGPLSSSPPAMSRDRGQIPLAGVPPEPPPGPPSQPDGTGPIWNARGYLHIYAAKHDLQLLYLDGEAAAKSSFGTLDSTDIWVLNDTSLSQKPEGDWVRAEKLCRIAETKWGRKIEGFIRMESGFEIIICSFDKSLKFIRQTTPTNLAFAITERGFPSSIFHWLAAAARRYDGIGGSPKRVILDYDTFVSAYSSSMTLFDKDTNHLPRLDRDDTRTLQRMRQDLAEMASNFSLERMKSTSRIDWQAITDFIVAEFANPLPNLAHSRELAVSGKRLAQELTYLMYSYIDTKHRDDEKELARCIDRFLPYEYRKETNTNSTPDLASRAIHEVMHTICQTLYTVLRSLPPPEADATEDVVPTDQIQALQTLIKYLDWPVWKRCKGCAYDEICMIPMFPFGSLEDFHHPTCKNAEKVGSEQGYWYG